MEPVWEDDAAIWVDDRLGEAGPFPQSRALAVKHRGETVAGIVFHNWDPQAGLIEVSAAAEHPRWATRRVLNEALFYAFDLIGCQMVYARQLESNTRARSLWLKLGAFETIVPRLRGRDTVGTIVWLTDDAWKASKFYEARHGW